MTCTRCARRDAAPGYDLCRQCRFYTRMSSHDSMVKVTVALPPSMLADLKGEAQALGESLAFVIRRKIARGQAS